MPFTIPAESGGFGGPSAVGVVLQELQSGANTAFQMYPGLTHGAADLMEHFALDEDRKRFLPAMLDGRYSGTMCLSEPHAGSDVGATRTRARHLEGNVYAITGTKCWISAGDHDLTQNIVHMVLARIEGAPTGTKGLSLFIVPKVWVNDDGTPRRAQRRHHGVHRAQARHPGLGDRGAELRRRGPLPRHPGGRPAARGHAPDVPHDERRAHRRRRAGDRGRLDRLPQRAGVRARAAAGLVDPQLQGPQRAAGGDPRALRRPPPAARDEGQGRGHARAGHQAGAARRPRPGAGRERCRRRRPSRGAGRSAHAGGEGL